MHAGYLLLVFFVFFFFPLHILTNCQQKSWFLCFYFFSTAGQGTSLLSGISQLPGPRVICRDDRLAFYLLLHFHRWLSKAGWLYFFPEETKTHPDPPLEINAFPKDFIRIFFREGGRIRTIFKVLTEFVTLLLLYIFGFLTVRHVASQLPRPGIKLTPRPPQHWKVKS